MSSSFEFSLIIEDEERQTEENQVAIQLKQNIYKALQQAPQQSFPQIISLQELLKMQSLLLEYQQKKKNDRIKEIQYNYTNAYSNYLFWSKSSDRKEQFILLNHKDLITINDQLPSELQKLLKILVNPQKFNIKNDFKPSLSFVKDFMNFWPLWHLRIQQLTELQLSSCQNIEAAFESEYTFASKIISNLRLNDRVQRFCVSIFDRVLIELESIKEQLIVDFSGLYDKWNDELSNLPQLKRFLEGGDPDGKAIRAQIEKIFGKIRGDQQAKILLEQMIHFERKQSPISFLLSEVGEDEMPEGINLRLAWLVWKKIVSNRKKLENLATSLLASILQSFPSIPHEIKFVVRCFKECAQKKFGEVRFEDIKNFFNKVIFSQLFFSEFMNLYELRVQQSSNNTNLTLMALVSQKIMFGQQFYEKFKFGFLNSVIIHYSSIIRQFIKGFVSSTIHQPPANFMNNILLSFQSIKTAYQLLVSEKQAFPYIAQCIQSVSSHNIAGKNYPLKNMFVYLSQKIQVNYSLVLRPSNKIKRTFIEFLILIDKISEKNSISELLEQYRCSEDDIQGNQPSVKLYAIYLSEIIKEIKWINIIIQMEKEITENKKLIEKIKIGLEKQFNYSGNLQKMYMRILNERRKIVSKEKIRAQIDKILDNPFGFSYEIIQGKICQGSSSASKTTFRNCLKDISECFLNKLEGVEGLYHSLCERTIQELQKGVVPDNMAQNTKSILGEKLYEIMGLENYTSEKDLIILKQMQRHTFITPQMLDLANFEAQAQIIVNQSQKQIKKLLKPQCPDSVIRIFYEITLIIQNVILTTGSASDITADIQIPLMIITLIRCRVKNLATLIEFIDQFCSDQIHSSVLGQTLTLLKSASYLVEEMDKKKLNISEEEYSNFVINSSYIIVE